MVSVGATHDTRSAVKSSPSQRRRRPASGTLRSNRRPVSGQTKRICGQNVYAAISAVIYFKRHILNWQAHWTGPDLVHRDVNDLEATEKHIALGLRKAAGQKSMGESEPSAPTIT